MLLVVLEGIRGSIRGCWNVSESGVLEERRASDGVLEGESVLEGVIEGH